MPIYIGENKIVDCYLGDKLLEAAYIGSQKVYDPYTEITGALPLNFNSRAAGALKNYRAAGAENGVGVQTINLLDVDDKDTENGYISDAYLTYQGVETESENYDVSEYIPILAETDYSIIARKVNSPGCCFYDATKQFISGICYSNTRPRNFTTPTGAAYLRMTITRLGVGTGEGGEDMLLLGTYSEQPDFEPYGYKIPLALTTEVTEEMFDKDAKDTEKGFVNSSIIDNGGVVRSSSQWCVSEYIPIKIGVTYRLYWGYDASSSAAVAFYNTNKEVLGGHTYGSTVSYTFTPNADGYLRFSYRKALAEETSLSTSEQNTDIYPLFIGSTKLGAEEYLDYGEQKVYKDVSGVLTPVDPPVSLPAISAYKGENTLSDPMVQTEVYSFEQGNYGGNPGEQLFKHNSSHDYFNKAIRVSSILTVPAGQKWLIATKIGWATTIRIANSSGIVISTTGSNATTTNPIVIEASTSERKLGIHTSHLVNGSVVQCTPSDYGGDLDITVVDAGALGSMMIKGRISELNV